ncbi:MAG TPA: hypothetical protein VEX35_14400, partial [Allosphingosinicella sp.]|nr:hypothetical protein [Allosphingosinicella sp.]
MTNTLLRAGALSCALLASTALTQPAMAQTAQEHRALDANGVDLTHGDFVAPAVPEGSIGSGEAELALIRQGVWVTGGVNSNGHQWDRIWLGQQPAGGGGSTLTVNLGERFEHFSSTGVISPRTGSSLSGGGGSIDYRTADGAVVTFADPAGSTGPVSNFCNGSAGQDYCMLLPAAITSPDGKTLTLNWDIWVRNLPGDSDGDGNPDYDYAARIASISNGFGYEIRFTYASNGSGGTTAAAPSSWYQRTGAAFHNVPASGGTALGSVSYSYPSAGVTEVTDMGGRVWRVTGTVNGISAIRRPGASSDTIAITGTPAAVTSVTRDGVTTNYARSVSGSIATMTVTDALSQTTTVVSDLTIGQVTSVTDPLNRTTGYQYDGYGRLERVTAPEGNYVQYSYDARGNVTETRAVAKSGTGLPDIVTSATYDATCSNPLECNRPNSVTDTRGNVTDYTYDATHGQVLTVTAPAPAGSGDRPEARYSYTALSGIYHLTGVSACAAGAAPSCVGTADETRTVIGYDARGNLTSTEQRDGTGTLSASRAMTYDALGNLLTVDGPLSGSADTIRYRYNAARQIVGVVGPDPDGGGARKHRAMRATYANDLPTSVEQGNVDSQSDGDWANFAAQQRVEQDYDANARPVVQRLMSGSTAYALTQTSYDALGRVQCAAQRMNSAEFASLPSDACTLDTAGSFGPDRIARTTYDAAGQVTKVETGYGVSGVAADEMIATYRANGRVETVTDANGNKTTYVYDGHDRLSQTRMPHPSTPGTSSTTDFEELTYLTATVGGNTVATPLVAGRRLRDGNSFAFAYDALGRLVERDPPELSNVSTDATTAYGYDNLGRLTSAVQASLSLSVTFAYDALGRTTSETGTFGTVAYQYDLAGRRTRLSWPGSALYVDYDRLVTGEVSAIRENGATTGAGVLGSYVYDDLGRRTLLTRGNGATTSWSYDNVSRLTGLSHGLAGTASDVTFAYAYDPAGGIASRTRDNDGYAYTALANANVTNTVNGLNQVTATSGSSLSYDARGNVIAVPAAASPTGSAATYDYYAENGLVHGPGGSAFIPDPLGRLFVSYAPALGATYYLMDGQTIVAELDSGSNVTRRYVHGPG